MTTEASLLIYVVDDDDAVRDSLCALLEISGYQTESFAHAAAFRAGFETGKAACLFLDVRLPDASGLDVSKEFKTAAPELPIIIMTGHGDVPMAVEAMREGARDFIEKPFEEGRMLEALTRALGASPSPQPLQASSEDADKLSRLTPRETDVLLGLIAGKANKVIAYDLGLSPRTVEIHRSRVMKKTEADSLSDLVKIAIRAGIDA